MLALSELACSCRWPWNLWAAAGPYCIDQSREPRSSCSDIAVTSPRRLRTDPEGVQLAIAEVEAKSYGLPRNGCKVRGILPDHLLQRPVGAHRHTVGCAERR